MQRNNIWFLLLIGVAACVELEDELGTTAQTIEDGTAASQFQLSRAADLNGCSGTRISDRHVLTALHCTCITPDGADSCVSQLGRTVRFYSSGPGSTSTSARRVTAIHRRPGTQWNDDGEDWTDSNGDFADIAILELNDDVTIGTTATLAWNYPGDDIYGVKVGAGGHEDQPNGSGILLQRSDYTRSGNDSGGTFYTDEHGTNGGDSGGPFYHGARVLGTLTGAKYLAGYRGWYTSVPFHLDWILSKIDYEWPGSEPRTNTFRFGDQTATITGASERICQYACDRSSLCVAYNWLSMLRTCSLLKTVTGAGTLSGWKSARK